MLGLKQFESESDIHNKGEVGTTRMSGPRCVIMTEIHHLGINIVCRAFSLTCCITPSCLKSSPALTSCLYVLPSDAVQRTIFGV